MNLPLKKGWLIAIGTILLFIISNPSSKRFKDFGGYEHFSQFKRTSNWVVFSTYQDIDTEQRYVGVFFNFFKL